VYAEGAADRRHELLQRVIRTGLRGQQWRRDGDDRLQLCVHIGPVPRRPHAQLLSGGDDTFGALQPGEVIAEVRVLGAQLQVLV